MEANDERLLRNSVIIQPFLCEAPVLFSQEDLHILRSVGATDSAIALKKFNEANVFHNIMPLVIFTHTEIVEKIQRSCIRVVIVMTQPLLCTDECADDVV